MSRVVRLGIVGAGGISALHLRSANEKTGAKVVAISDINEAAVTARAAEYGIPNTYTDYKRMISEADIDAVVICVPNFLHHVVAIDAMRAGKHVLCEKPMAVDLAAAEQMAAVAKETGLVLSVGMVNRFRPEVQALKQRVVKGELGNLYFGKTIWLRRKGIPGWGTWFTRKALSGGGPLIDIGVHMLDLAWYLLGTPRPVTVSGVTYAAFGPERRGIGTWGTPNFNGVFDVEDLASALIRFENGASVTLDVSWAINAPDQQSVTIVGDKAGAMVGNGTLKLFAEVDNKVVEEELRPEPGPLDRGELQIHDFVTAIREGVTPVVPVEHGLWMNRMLGAIYESAQQGAEVRL